MKKMAGILAADYALQAAGVKVFQGLKRNAAPPELPAVILELSDKREEPITDYPFVVEVHAIVKVTILLEVFDPEKGEWIGGARGKGVGTLDQDVRRALQGDLNLSGTTDFWTFGPTSFVDRWPNRGSEFTVDMKFREAMSARVP